MNVRAALLSISAISVWSLAACNWTIGDCYPVGERTSGAGAGPGSEPRPIYTSAASGDFGADPQGGGERKIACNESDLEDDDEEEEERTTQSPEKPTDPCQRSGAPSMGCTGKIPIDPRAFNFVTIVAYDGTGVAGGWQETKTYLAFGHDNEGDSTCMVHIGMPLRSEEWGTISSDRAAQISADVANWSADMVYEKDRGAQLPPGIFCKTFKSRIAERFISDFYKGLGARLKNP
ncbi:hypothetical protein WMF26_46985 [Sorangium sp. So ce185]|uniref:hypothetical protein n=1 Tax=Sorangium sp. So ce185 TaxID=3133287 RepID=UPI003F6426A5